MKDNLVSVLLPVWEAKPELLSISIKSILEQTYTNIELLIIYQRSFEQSDTQIEKIFDENSDDHRLRVIETKKGFTNAVNVGLEHSRGQYVARMDADDISEKIRFEEQLDYLSKTNIDLVGSWAYSISEGNKIIGKIQPPITNDEIRNKIMFHNPFLHSSIFLRKSVFKKIGNYNPRFEGAEDYELYFRIMSQGYRFGNVPKYLSYIRDAIQSRSRGSEWRKQRSFYIKAKNKAVFNYGFTKPIDIIYYTLTPIAYFMSPKLWSKIKVLTWNK